MSSLVSNNISLELSWQGSFAVQGRVVAQINFKMNNLAYDLYAQNIFEQIQRNTLPFGEQQLELTWAKKQRYCVIEVKKYKRLPFLFPQYKI